MKKSFILFTSSPENLCKIRSMKIASEYDIVISFDEVSLICSIKHTPVKPLCIFFDITCGELDDEIKEICDSNNLPILFYDPHIDEIDKNSDLYKKLSGISGNGIFDEIDGTLADEFIPGKSQAITEFKKKLVLAAKSDIPVLMLGENGSGKTIAAKAIHQLSRRRLKKFFPVNVAAFSEGLIESELFGSVEGAYTGAKKRSGYFKSADKSTLFLDEIGELKCHLQAKLLTFLDSGEFRNVGSDETQCSDVRLICATNANVKKKMMENEFREDFYYRIKGLELKVPPLRERKTDIPILSDLFLKRSGKVLSPEAEELLKTFDWPGNIRQLQHCIECAVLFSQNRKVILPRDIIY